MAITNAQQYQQLVNKSADGKRPGYRGIGGYQEGKSAPSSKSSSSGKSSSSAGKGGGADIGRSPVDKSTAQQTANTKAAINSVRATKDDVREQYRLNTPVTVGEVLSPDFTKVGTGSTMDDNRILASNLATRPFGGVNTPFGAVNVFGNLFGGFGYEINKKFFLENIAGKKGYGYGYEDFAQYLQDRGLDKVDAYGNPVTRDRDGGNTVLTPYQEDVVEDEVDPNSLEGILANRGLAYRFMADGGRASFQQGSPAPIAPKIDPRMAKSLQENISANEAQRAANISRKEAQTKAIQDIRNAISSGGKEGLGSLLKEKFGVANPSQVPGYSSYSSPLTGVSSSARERMTNALIQNYLNPSAQGSGTYGASFENSPYASMFVSTPGGMFDPYSGTNLTGSYGVMLDGNLYKSEQDAINALGIERYNQLMANGGRAGFAGGGMPYEGGIMDLESARQMYGLGKLVKKATGAIKKIVKSPVGKAALLYFGGNALMGKMGGLGGLRGALFGQAGSRVGQLSVPFKEGLLTKLGLTKGGGSFMPTALGGISLASLAGLLSSDEDETQPYYRGPGLDIDAIRRDPYGTKGPAFGFYAKGGDVKEPVAKDTMPLLDMNGMEKDYRADGGFVPIGRMERADDVPARLSKNEFVFTADAVRNAGDGDIDKGAEVMYNVMKNLEAGGNISEESQGLNGARNMFQTSKRLEEVL